LVTTLTEISRLFRHFDRFSNFQAAEYFTFQTPEVTNGFHVDHRMRSLVALLLHSTHHRY